ncbi:multidrug ABC transporter permease [Methanomassiliicoccales archaeon RumEn M1]|nr:multidrug ABC transporter permease [Methanomassiliicoccales archaeon RumEn M1]
MKRVGNQVLASILVNAIYEMKNYPVVLLNTVLSPLSFLVLIFLISDGALLGEAILGGLIMSMFQSGISLQSDLSHLKNDFKLQEIVVSSPTSSAVYVAGMALSEIIYSSPAIIILAILFALVINVPFIQVAGIVIILLMVFLSSVALSFALSTLSTDIVQSYSFSRLITILFTSLAPVYYPVTLIPEPLQPLAYLSPTTYAAQLAQHMAGLTQVSSGMFVFDWAVLLIFTAVFLWVGYRKARWRDV